tara:strand:+ start:1043 stop:1279 length:237 start_codon:yes stop_codon:yes gene_type:complete
LGSHRQNLQPIGQFKFNPQKIHRKKTKIMTTYYTIEKNTWVKTILSPEKLSWRWIRLYDEELKFKGIGMYPRINKLIK